MLDFVSLLVKAEQYGLGINSFTVVQDTIWSHLQEIGFGFHVSDGELDNNGKLLKRKKVGNDKHDESDDKSNEDTVVKSKNVVDQ